MGLLCAPFLRVRPLAPPAGPACRWLLEELTLRHGPMVHSVQLAGREPEWMARVAREVEARGADVIDLNFGCPARTLVRKGVGAALLSDLDRLSAIIRAVRDAVSVAVSAKVRLGSATPDESLAIAEAVQRAGATFLTVHARTLADRYGPPARWDWLTRVVQAVDLPVVGNGDVWTAADALRMREETGCAAVMIGRGALRNPWIFRQIEQLDAGRPVSWPSLTEIHSFLSRLRDAQEAVVRPRKRVSGKVKEIVSYVGLMIDDDGAWRRRVLHTRDLPSLYAALDELPTLEGVGLVTGPPRQRAPSPP